MTTSLKTLVFTDLVNSSAVKTVLPGQDIEARNRAFLETIKTPHDQRIFSELATMGGRVVNEMGDGFFIAFDDPVRAVRWADGVQRIHQEQPIATPLGPLAVKIGVHIGAPLPNPHNPGDYIGHEVDYAARLCALARGSMVVVSEAMAILLRNAMIADFRIVPHGAHDLKGIGSVPVFEVLRPGQAPGALLAKAPKSSNLPRPPATFIGRDALLETVRAQLRAGGVTVLWGEGGMGKTVMALKAANDAHAAGELPGGAAWLNCELEPGRDECLRQMARVFFGDRMEEEPVDVCDQRVVEHLERGDALAVFDNFESVASDAGLIAWLSDIRPPARVLLTSRKRLVQLNSVDIAVRELPLHDARTLFIERANRAGAGLGGGEPQIDAICKAVDGQPLAIELLAARAALIPLPRMFERLEASAGIIAAPGDTVRPNRHRSAELCVEWSFKELSAPAKGLLQSMCVLPDGASVGAIKAVIGEHGWDEAAEELVAASVWRLSGGRYSMHPLVRSIALGQTGDRRETFEGQAGRALAMFVMERAEKVRSSAADPAAIKGAIDWCEAELHNLTAAVDFACSAGDWKSVHGLSSTIFHVFQIRGHWSEAEHLYSQALAAARRSGDHAHEVRALNNLGWIYRRLGRWADAEVLHRQCLELCRELGDRREEGHTLKHLGRVLQLRGRYDESSAICEQALALLRETGDAVGEAKALAFLGNVHRFQGRWDAAVEVYEQALAISRRIRDHYDEGEVLHRLGQIYLQQKRWDAARQALQRSLAIWHEFNDRHSEAVILDVLGCVLRDEGRWDEAEATLRQSLAVFREFHARHREGGALLNLARLEAARGHVTSALDLGREAVGLLEHTQDQWLLARAREFISEIPPRAEH